MTKTALFIKFIEGLKKGVCIKEFAARWSVTQRTVQRYLEDFIEIFEIEPKLIQKGCYQVLSLDVDKILFSLKEAKELEEFINQVSVINPGFLKYLRIDTKLIQRFQKNNEVFLVKTSPIERIENSEIFNKAIKIVKYRKICDIEYFSDKAYFFEKFKPYKIVFNEGNFYLAGISNDEINNGFKFLRINFIRSINETSKTFKREKKVVEFLEKFQSLMSRFKEPFFEVIVEVDEEVARFFKAKKFLPSQQILEDNGKLKIRYIVNSDEEILFLAKRWLPHMKIIYPTYLDDKLKNIISSYFSK